jgi:hypothetical protein
MMNNQFIIRILESGDACEALTWLTEKFVPERTLGEAKSREAGIALVKSLYKIGAIKVLVFNIDIIPTGEQNSGRLIVELPKGSTERANLLAKCAEIGAEQGFDPEPDYGQRYTILMLD